MDDFVTIAYVPRRIFELYEAVYAYPQEVCDMSEDALQLANDATEAEHYQARCFMFLYENQDLHGAVKVVIVDDPTLDRLYQVLPDDVH